MNPLLLGAALYLGTKYIGTGRAASKLQFKPIGLKIKNGKLNVICTVVNPTGTSIQIDGVFISFFMDLGDKHPTKIGSINIGKSNPFKIDKRGESTIYLPISLAGLGLIGLGLKVASRIKNKSGFVPEVTAVGTIVSLGIVYPINEVVPIDLGI